MDNKESYWHSGIIDQFYSTYSPPENRICKYRFANGSEVVASYVERIDATHANATNAWIDMGSPGSLSAAQVASLEKSSSLVKEPFGITSKEKIITINIDIPPQGIACITLETN